MADIFCMAMYPESDSTPATSNSIISSLHLPHGLLGGSRRDNSPSAPAPSDSNVSIHLRIVPSIDCPHRSFIFTIVDRQLKAGTIIKIGRFTDRNTDADHISLKSKVVSRTHCEIWVGVDGKLYLKDTKSSSGTFVNHVRLSSTHQASQPTEIHDGDIVQLGIDYQGGIEEVYRAVKMRFELNHQVQPLAFNTTAFNHIKTLACSPPLSSTSTTDSHEDAEECCICLYALAPSQALFVAPCSHTFHFKCIRPLLHSYPGFQCPLCRGYADLEASVAVEELATPQMPTTTIGSAPIAVVQTTTTEQSNDGVTASDIHPVETLSASPPSSSSSPPPLPPVSSSAAAATDPGAPYENISQPSTERRLSASHLMDKIKMAFSEKRKAPVVLRKYSGSASNSHNSRAHAETCSSSEDEGMSSDQGSSYPRPPVTRSISIDSSSEHPLANILEEGTAVTHPSSL